MKTCKRIILGEIVMYLAPKLVLSFLQYYALYLIFVVARQNEQKMRKAICT